MNKKTSPKTMKWLKVLFILFLIGAFASGSYFYWLLLQNGKQIYEVRTFQVTTLMKYNPDFFEKTFTSILPATIQCNRDGQANCTSSARSQFDQLFSEANQTKFDPMYNIPLYFGNNSLVLVPVLPMYFIKLEDEKIAKIYLSGDLKLESIDTAGEKAVKEVLEGKRKQLYGPQANWPGYEMTYLNDFLSEAEVIVPYEKNGKVIGAVVFLHGD